MSLTELFIKLAQSKNLRLVCGTDYTIEKGTPASSERLCLRIGDCPHYGGTIEQMDLQAKQYNLDITILNWQEG